MNEKECTDDVNNDLKEIARDIIEEALLGIVENVESEIDEIENENINQKDFENIKKMLDGSEALLRIIVELTSLKMLIKTTLLVVKGLITQKT